MAQDNTVGTVISIAVLGSMIVGIYLVIKMIKGYSAAPAAGADDYSAQQRAMRGQYINDANGMPYNPQTGAYNLSRQAPFLYEGLGGKTLNATERAQTRAAINWGLALGGQASLAGVPAYPSAPKTPTTILTDAQKLAQKDFWQYYPKS